MTMFKLDDYALGVEREFVAALAARAEAWSMFGLTADDVLSEYHDGILVLGFDITDWERNVIIRTLQIDYADGFVIVGEDKTGALVTNLDTTQTDVAVLREPGSPPQRFANFAADWVELELRKHFERRHQPPSMANQFFTRLCRILCVGSIRRLWRRGRS